MSNQSNSTSRTGSSFDIKTILRDLSGAWVSIILIALSVALLATVFSAMMYHPNYTTKATMLVKGSGRSNVYNDIYTSSQVASKFTEIVNSNVLQHKVAKAIGQKSFIGTASASNIADTNIIEISVTAPSAETSFMEMKAILENYDSVSDYVLDGVILKTLEPPRVSEQADAGMSQYQIGFLAFLATFVLLVSGLGYLSMRRDTIRTEKDIDTKLDTSLLVTVPHESTARNTKEKITREKRNLLITDPTLGFRYVEAMDKLARRVKTRMDDMGAKTLLVTSVMQNEGKSSVTANLALSMAKQGMKVVLMDCDLRKPSQYKILGMEDDEFVSLGECLRDHSEPSGIIRQLEGTDLFCVLNKTILDNSTELITSDTFREILGLLKANVDYVIIDSSPVAMVADAGELAVIADAAVLVVRQNMVEAVYINDAIDSINASREKLLGCVFNNVYEDTPIRALSYYGGGYSANRYSYGKYDQRGGDGRG